MSREQKNKKKAVSAGAKAKKGVKKAVSAIKKAAKKAAPSKKATAKKATAKKVTAKKVTAKKATAKKATVKKATAKKATVKKATVKKATAKKATAKKATVKKATAKKATVKKATVKKATAKKATVKKATAKKAAPSIRKSTFNRRITALLLEARNKILQEVSEKVRTESEEPKDVVGDIHDIASTERERELSLIFGDRDRAKLSEIEDAFDRLKLDCYEECEECGEPIAQKRLLAMPFTRVCVECKSKHERRQRATGRYEEEAPVGVGILERSSADDDDF